MISLDFSWLLTNSPQVEPVPGLSLPYTTVTPYFVSLLPVVPGLGLCPTLLFNGPGQVLPSLAPPVLMAAFTDSVTSTCRSRVTQAPYHVLGTQETEAQSLAMWSAWHEKDIHLWTARAHCALNHHGGRKKVQRVSPGESGRASPGRCGEVGLKHESLFFEVSVLSSYAYLSAG